MPYETYKLGKIQKYNVGKRYTYEELNLMDLPRLREICNKENIKPPTIATLENKKELVSLIYRYLGIVRKPNIIKYEPEAVSRLEKMIGNEQTKQSFVSIELPAQLKIYKGFDSLNEKNMPYTIKTDVSDLGEFAFLMDEERSIEAILNVQKGVNAKEYILELGRNMMSKGIRLGSFHKMSLLFFTADFMEEVISIYNGTSGKKAVVPYFRIRVPEVLVTEVLETEEVLVIDYGTSFTTAGTYSPVEGGSRRIGFAPALDCGLCSENGADRIRCEKCELCPSVIAVKSCKDNKIEFIFGHEAVDEERKRGYISKNSVFYDTKRWVNHYKEQIRVTDFEGNSCEVERSLIVGAYLIYIIKTAEQQNKVRYKNIYLTCPVKQKALSLKMYKDVLINYNVLINDMTDEAVAVVYHSLDKQIEELSYQSGETQKVLILDCGGGTSDMVRCDYRIYDRSITSEIDMKIRYAHGDTNFGGNNLTYRILQYIKIRLGELYASEKIMSIDDLFPDVLQDMYEFVDEYGGDEAYCFLEKRYRWAEEIIPTSFEVYKNTSEQTYLKVKGNYYFLWNLAENIKKEFYNSVGTVQVALRNFFSDSGAKHSFYENFNLSVKNKNGVLETHTLCPNIIMIKEEINLLLKPDIYLLMKEFIEPYYLDGLLEDINRIYMSGQTSKIELFREVLKEFIEGRKAKSSGENSCIKKFMCIDGAIAYQGAKKIGRIRSEIQYASPIVPYNLTVPDFHLPEREKYLIYEGTTMEEIYGYQSRSIETEEIIFTLRDRAGRELNKYIYKINYREHEEISYDFLMNKYPILRQEDLDNIVNREVKIFIFCKNEDWGFYVLEAARQEDKLYYKEPQYIPFENTQWEINFFDGMH